MLCRRPLGRQSRRWIWPPSQWCASGAMVPRLWVDGPAVPCSILLSRRASATSSQLTFPRRWRGRRRALAERLYSAASSGLAGERYALGLRSSVAFPVMDGASVWGAFVAHAGPDSDAVAHEDVLLEFAAVVELAVANAQRFDCLEAMAATDSLTGLMNHRTFFARLDAEISRAKRYRRDLTSSTSMISRRSTTLLVIRRAARRSSRLGPSCRASVVAATLSHGWVARSSSG